MRSIGLSRAGVVALLAILVLPLPTAAVTVYPDAVGDTLFRAPSYLDIVEGRIDESGGTFTFELTVAGAIPSSPDNPPPGNGLLWWNFVLDTDPTTFPADWPNSAGVGQYAPPEFIVGVEWDGDAFTGSVWDRRPNLVGLPAVRTPVAFDITGTVISLTVDASLLGDPTEFIMSAVTVALSNDQGSNDARHVIDGIDPHYNPWP